MSIARPATGTGPATIRVVEADPAWPAHFAMMKHEIAARLGDFAEDIHHIGSTSVPGLAAKPKIDIDAVIRSQALLAGAVERIRADPAWTFHGDRYGDGMWIFTQGRGSWGVRLYLCGPGSAKHEKRMLFRDYLRADPARAVEYAALKRRLALEADGDWDAYTGGKAAFVAETVRLATDFFRRPALADDPVRTG